MGICSAGFRGFLGDNGGSHVLVEKLILLHGFSDSVSGR